MGTLASKSEALRSKVSSPFQTLQTVSDTKEQGYEDKDRGREGSEVDDCQIPYNSCKNELIKWDVQAVIMSVVIWMI